MNHFTLKATRKALGLEVADACQLVPSPKTGEPPQKRWFQYLESGRNAIPKDVELTFDTHASYYHLLLTKLTADIQAFKLGSPLLTTDNSGEHLKNIKNLILPYFVSFE